MLIKIISGGQTGADRAGLIAARNFNIDTGGWMPKGYKAHDGYHPEFSQLYNIKEHSSPQYPPRTALNVKESDGTIQFASNFNSPGELLTSKMIIQYNKPRMLININTKLTKPDDVINWIIENKIKTLNIAGNSERTSPGIQDYVIEFLSEMFIILNSKIKQKDQ